MEKHLFIAAFLNISLFHMNRTPQRKGEDSTKSMYMHQIFPNKANLTEEVLDATNWDVIKVAMKGKIKRFTVYVFLNNFRAC
jgi:hypothetical protein